ncbi:MAG TPA: HD domain-containing protein [Longimicrobiaceae bacterium]|nr:HD domain-containing protein [Longimicrobiaceae bacterium]
MDSTELPDVVRAAARGELPEWADARPERRAHIERVARLLGEWADALGLPPAERDEWVAAGWLHDSLRDAPADRLRPLVPPELGDLHPLLLHGPAAAERLRGQASDRLLDAVRFHTLGHPRLDRLGRALYLADFLEPGRDFSPEWRAELRGRMPHDLDAVLREVVASRIRHLVDAGKPIRPETAAFWSSLVGEA